MFTQNFNENNLWTHVALKVKNLSLRLNSLQPWGTWQGCRWRWIQAESPGSTELNSIFFKFCAIDLNICGQRVFLCYFKGWKQQRASLFELFWISSNLMCCLQIRQSSICSEAVTKDLTNNRGAALLGDFLSGADGQKTSELFVSPENGMTVSNFHM